MTTKYFTAKSYKNAEWISEPFEKNNKMYVYIREICPRCNGKGNLYGYGHINNGICYKCNGVGFETNVVRLYTEKELAAIEKAKETRERNKQLKAEAESEVNKKAEMVKNGFDENGFTWCVFGGNTYAIKELLKELGCKFDTILQWHCNHPIELPDGYSLFSVAFDDIFVWDCYHKRATYKDGAGNFIKQKINENAVSRFTEYFDGSVGERIKGISATLSDIRGFSGQYGWTHIYTFENESNVFTWFTTKPLNIEIGTKVTLTGTIKKFEEYKGIKTTQLSRCIINI